MVGSTYSVDMMYRNLLEIIELTEFRPKKDESAIRCKRIGLAQSRIQLSVTAGVDTAAWEQQEARQSGNRTEALIHEFFTGAIRGRPITLEFSDRMR